MARRQLEVIDEHRELVEGTAGRRDHALVLTAVQTGLRVTELVTLRVEDVVVGAGPHVRCLGKKRKGRATPYVAHHRRVAHVAR